MDLFYLYHPAWKRRYIYSLLSISLKSLNRSFGISTKELVSFFIVDFLLLLLFIISGKVWSTSTFQSHWNDCLCRASATIAVVLIQGNGGQGLIKYVGMAELIVETGISKLACPSAPCNGTQLNKRGGEREGKIHAAECWRAIPKTHEKRRTFPNDSNILESCTVKKYNVQQHTKLLWCIVCKCR